MGFICIKSSGTFINLAHVISFTVSSEEIVIHEIEDGIRVVELESDLKHLKSQLASIMADALHEGK